MVKPLSARSAPCFSAAVFLLTSTSGAFPFDFSDCSCLSCGVLRSAAITVSISLAWSRSAEMSIEVLAGVHVRANASHSARIGSRFATMKSDSRMTFRLEAITDASFKSGAAVTAAPCVGLSRGTSMDSIETRGSSVLVKAGLMVLSQGRPCDETPCTKPRAVGLARHRDAPSRRLRWPLPPPLSSESLSLFE